jgi:hypothetical protein
MSVAHLLAVADVDEHFSAFLISCLHNKPAQHRKTLQQSYPSRGYALHAVNVIGQWQVATLSMACLPCCCIRAADAHALHCVNSKS